MVLMYSRFVLQAEDGIRGKLVTGVQTCALPIFEANLGNQQARRAGGEGAHRLRHRRRRHRLETGIGKELRSEERRVGKESRSRSSSLHKNNNVFDGCGMPLGRSLFETPVLTSAF